MHPQTPCLYPRACDVCAKTDDLTQCPDCLIVLYCSDAHRASDHERHKHICRHIAECHANLQACLDRLHNIGSAFQPGFRILSDEQRLKKVRSARPFLMARVDLARTILHELGSTNDSGEVTGSFPAAEAALEHLLDATRLARADRRDISNVVPAVYLALDRDQEAYDFVRWSAATEKHYNEDGWADTPTSDLDLRGADVLEGVHDAWARHLEVLEDAFPLWRHRLGEFPSYERDARLSYHVAVLLVKVRAYLDLRQGQNAARALWGSLPAEIVDLICRRTLRGALAQRPDIQWLDVEGTAALMRALKVQIRIMWLSSREVDTVFWDRLLRGQGIGDVIERVDPDTRALWERWHVTPWLTTPGAMDIVNALRNEPVQGEWKRRY